MSANTPLAGTAYFSVDGVNYNLVGTMTYQPSSVERETLTGMDAVHGFSEKPKAGKMKATLRDAGGLTVAAFNRMRNNTVVFELVNGKVVTGRNMWTIDSQEVNVDEATFEVSWEGPAGSVTEQAAS